MKEGNICSCSFSLYGAIPSPASFVRLIKYSEYLLWRAFSAVVGIGLHLYKSAKSLCLRGSISGVLFRMRRKIVKFCRETVSGIEVSNYDPEADVGW